MKRELSSEISGLIYESWPGQFETFSPLEFACGIPHTMFAITTLKENGMPNVCLHSWSCFSGDSGGFFAIMAGLCRRSHTYSNIVRDGSFCINFLSEKYFDACMNTVRLNSPADDEFAAGGFTRESCRVISSPRIAEAFLSLECKLEYNVDISKKGINSLIIGRVVHAAAEEAFMEGLDKKYSENGFMLNIHSPTDYATGKNTDGAVAFANILRTTSDY